MKRGLLLLGALALVGFASGCADESREDLVARTLNTMTDAAKQTETITKAVKKAVEKAKQEGSKQLDLEEAKKAVEGLAQVSQRMQEVKQKIESVRGKITEQEKQENFDTKRAEANSQFKRLQAASAALESELKQAEEINGAETRELRERINKAIGLFESQSRQAA